MKFSAGFGSPPDPGDQQSTKELLRALDTRSLQLSSSRDAAPSGLGFTGPEPGAQGVEEPAPMGGQGYRRPGLSPRMGSDPDRFAGVGIALPGVQPALREVSENFLTHFFSPLTLSLLWKEEITSQ